jgi:hypothetical protein
MRSGGKCNCNALADGSTLEKFMESFEDVPSPSSASCQRRESARWLAPVLSGGCAIHCLMMPVLATAAPFLDGDPWVEGLEAMAIGLVFFVSFLGLIRTWRSGRALPPISVGIVVCLGAGVLLGHEVALGRILSALGLLAFAAVRTTPWVRCVLRRWQAEPATVMPCSHI